jgi:S1-C subfamily serine protease
MIFFLSGIFLGFCFGFFLLRLPQHQLLSSSLSPSPLSSLATPIPNLSWERIVAERELSSVAIQAFLGSKAIRSGSGIILSADGLILTTADVVPIKNATYQVSFNDQFVRGTVVAQDIWNNLALLKTDALGQAVADMRSKSAYEIGRESVLVGKRIGLSGSTPFAQRGMISYMLRKTNIIDTRFSPFLSGAQVIDSEGDFLGMAYVRSGQTLFVDKASIDTFVANYFQSLAK